MTESRDVTSVLDTPEAGRLLIRGVILRAAGYALGILLGVVSSAVVLRYLGVVDSGRLVTVMALIAVVSGISDLGLSSLAIREYASRSPGERGIALRNVLGLRIVFAATGVTVATLFAILVGYSSVMVVGTLLGGVALVVGVLQQHLSVPLASELRLGWITALTLLGQLGAAVGYLLLAAIGAGLLAFFGVQGLAFVPVAVLTYLLARGTIPFLPAATGREWRRIMRDIAPYAVAVVFYLLYFRFAVISVSLLSTERETGYYGASFRVLDVLATIPPLLVSSAFPLLVRAARDDRERLRYALERLLHATFVLGTWMAVSVFLGASLAIDVVAGEEFRPSVDPLRIQAAALFGTAVLAVCGYGLLSLARHRAILLSNFVSVLLAGGLSIALVPSHGAIGAAIALTVAELGLAFAYGIALLRAEPMLSRSLLVALRVFAAGAAALAVPVLLGLEDLAALLLSSVVYAGALLVLRAFPAEVVEALRRGRANPPRPRRAALNRASVRTTRNAVGAGS